MYPQCLKIYFGTEVSSDKTVLELDNTIKEESTGRTSLFYDRLDRLLAPVCILGSTNSQA